MIAVLTTLSLTAGNFIYQHWNGQNWMLAFDRSYSQALAIFTYWLAIKCLEWRR